MVLDYSILDEAKGVTVFSMMERSSSHSRTEVCVIVLLLPVGCFCRQPQVVVTIMYVRELSFFIRSLVQKQGLQARLLTYGSCTVHLDTGKATLWLLLTYHVDILLPFKDWSYILFLLRIVHLETGEVLITS